MFPTQRHGVVCRYFDRKELRRFLGKNEPARLRLESLEARDLLSRYLVTDLGDFRPAQMNHLGQMIGWVGIEPTLYDHGSLIDLGTPDGFLFAGPDALNDAGHAVGYGRLPDGTEHAIYWGDAGPVDIGGVGESAVHATAINDAEQIAGWSDDAGRFNAVYWSAPDAAPLAFSPGWAYAMNNAGQVTGKTAGGDIFIWTADGGMTYPPTPGGFGGDGNAINDNGDVAGFGYHLIGGIPTQEAVAWIGGVPHEIQNVGTAQAMGINDLGQVTGEVNNTTFLWDGRTHDLTRLVGRPGLRMRHVGQISDDGQILGLMMRNDGSAFPTILTPTAALSPDLGTALMAVQRQWP